MKTIPREPAEQYDSSMQSPRGNGGGITAADLVAIAAPLQLYPGWLPSEPRPIAGDCVIYDVGDAVPDQPGGVLLLVGARPSDSGHPGHDRAGRRPRVCVRGHQGPDRRPG